MTSNTKSKWMNIALQEASKGLGKTLSNPMVGSVIIHEEKLIASGFHEVFGGAHAEVNCLNKITDPLILQNSTLFVTLEPCFHYGKTPPCVELIIAKGIKNVIVASLDVNPLVAGKSIELMLSSGINVEVGILDKENKSLNKVFFWRHTRSKPFVTLKWAQSSDGYIAKYDLDSNSTNNSIITTSNKEHLIQTQLIQTKISSHQTDVFVHSLRANHQAILIGKNTAIIDNPSLTTRLVEGNSPIRIILDKKNELPTNLKVFETSTSYSIKLISKDIPNLTNNQSTPSKIIGIDYSDFKNEFNRVMIENDISSVLVEGGRSAIQYFVDNNMWNEAIVITSDNLQINQGLLAPTLTRYVHQKTTQIGDDRIDFFGRQS